MFWWRKAITSLRKSRAWQFAVMFALFAACTLVYYFAELVNLMQWQGLRWQFFYGVHDVHRVLFLLPIIFTAYFFGTIGAVSVSAASLLVFLPRALFISTYPDPVLRPVIFVVTAGLLGVFVSRLSRRKKPVELAASLPTTHSNENDVTTVLREDEVFVAGDIEVDVFRHQVRRGQQLVKLTPTEFKILTYLVYNRGRVITHVELLRRVWGPEYGQETEYLRVFIGQLRRKIEADPSHPILILTEPRIGYRITESDWHPRRRAYR